MSNLEWVSHKQNQKHAGENGLIKRGESHFKAKVTDKVANEMRLKFKEVGIVSAIADEFGVSYWVARGIVKEISYQPLNKNNQQ